MSADRQRHSLKPKTGASEAVTVQCREVSFDVRTNDVIQMDIREKEKVFHFMWQTNAGCVYADIISSIQNQKNLSQEITN